MIALLEEVATQGQSQGSGITLWANIERALEDFPGVHDILEYESPCFGGRPFAVASSHERIRLDHADRVHFSGTDGALFEVYRELIETLASDVYDAEGPFDEHGRILVTSEALTRVTRSA
jgi:hypothetical protein